MVMADVLSRRWTEKDGQNIAEYALILGVILVIVVRAIRLFVHQVFGHDPLSRRSPHNAVFVVWGMNLPACA